MTIKESVQRFKNRVWPLIQIKWSSMNFKHVYSTNQRPFRLQFSSVCNALLAKKCRYNSYNKLSSGKYKLIHISFSLKFVNSEYKKKENNKPHATSMILVNTVDWCWTFFRFLNLFSRSPNRPLLCSVNYIWLLLCGSPFVDCRIWSNRLSETRATYWLLFVVLLLVSRVFFLSFFFLFHFCTQTKTFSAVSLNRMDYLTFIYLFRYHSIMYVHTMATIVTWSPLNNKNVKRNLRKNQEKKIIYIRIFDAQISIWFRSKLTVNLVNHHVWCRSGSCSEGKCNKASIGSVFASVISLLSIVLFQYELWKDSLITLVSITMSITCL